MVTFMTVPVGSAKGQESTLHMPHVKKIRVFFFFFYLDNGVIMPAQSEN